MTTIIMTTILIRRRILLIFGVVIAIAIGAFTGMFGLLSIIPATF